MKNQMTFCFDPLITEGSWFIGSLADPLLRPVEAVTEAWTINLPASPNAWVPFHLLSENFRVIRLEP